LTPDQENKEEIEAFETDIPKELFIELFEEKVTVTR